MTPATFRYHRERHGSQRAVAKELGIAFGTLQRVESGQYGDPVPLKYQRMIAGLPDMEK